MNIQAKPLPFLLLLLDPAVHNASVKCDRMRSQKIRRRPESCHAYHAQVRVSSVHPMNDLGVNQRLQPVHDSFDQVLTFD